ncbi:MAG: hypothetical protein G01um101419_642 [Parcubacteria group bacterium Gr01-1014_19]|nr:MAG: hypothetical protein G01um101419_642 [Parcubacteria group bacterium Gr01-1014_19]
MRGLAVTFTKPLSVGTLGVTPGKVVGPHEGIFHSAIMQSFDASKGVIVLRSDYLIWRGLGKDKDIFLFLSAAPKQPQIELGKDWIEKIVDLETKEVIYQKPPA